MKTYIPNARGKIHLLGKSGGLLSPLDPMIINGGSKKIHEPLKKSENYIGTQNPTIRYT